MLNQGQGYRYLSMKATLYLIRTIFTPCALIFGPLCVLTWLNQLARLGDLVTGALGDIPMMLDMALSLMPTVLLHATTAAVFFGMMLGYEQLNRHSELVAFRALGFGLYRLMKPVIALALVTAISLSLLHLYLVPWSVSHLQKLMLESATRTLSSHLETDAFRPLSENTVIFHQNKEKQSETEELWENAFISFRSGTQNDGHLILFAPEMGTMADAKSKSLYLRAEEGSVFSLQDSSMTVIDFKRAQVALSIKDWLKNQTRSVTKYHSYSPKALLKAQKKAKGHQKRWLRFFLAEKLSNHFQLLPLLLLAALLSFAPKRNLRGRNWVMALLVFVTNYALYQLFRGLYLSNHIPLWLGALGPFIVLSAFTFWLWRKTLRACV